MAEFYPTDAIQTQREAMFLASARAAATERDRLREAIIDHRRAIEAAGDVYVSRVESARAAALKHAADQALWASAALKEKGR